MRSFFSHICFVLRRQRQDTHFRQHFHTSPRMASSNTSLSLYLATVSIPSIFGAKPENALDKKHHLQNGKGFRNPWDSWREQTVPDLLGGLLW